MTDVDVKSVQYQHLVTGVDAESVQYQHLVTDVDAEDVQYQHLVTDVDAESVQYQHLVTDVDIFLQKTCLQSCFVLGGLTYIDSPQYLIESTADKIIMAVVAAD